MYINFVDFSSAYCGTNQRGVTERDFKILLSPVNIQEVAKNPKDFVPQNVSRLNFTGSEDA